MQKEKLHLRILRLILSQELVVRAHLQLANSGAE
jgi:hypothetical protein